MQDQPNGEKRCTKCGETKPAGEFPRDAQKRDGKRPDCKRCVNEARAARYRANPEKFKASSKAYAAANPEKVKATKAAYYAAHREEHKTKGAAWAAANADKLSAYKREWSAANREKMAAYKNAHKTGRRRDFRDYLRSLKAGGCTDCGVQLPPDKLNWHHLDPATKVIGLSHMADASREMIDAEIAKCVLVCHTCHWKRHKLMRAQSRHG